MRILLFIFALCAALGCRADSQQNLRAYVEGTLTTVPPAEEQPILQLVNDGVIIAETSATSPLFVLSGPISHTGFSVISSHKIIRFTTNKTNLMLSPDGHEILVPAGITYINFSEITLEP